MCNLLTVAKQHGHTAPETKPEPPAPSGRPPRKAYPNFSLRDRVYVITGGGRGLGLAQAEAISQAGAKVHCFDRLPEPDPGFYLAQEDARRYRGSLHYHHVDVRSSEGLDQAVAGIVSLHGKINGLVAAAGVQQLKQAVDYTSQDVAEMMDINYTGVFMSASSVARQMIARQTGGSIVLVASMSGIIANKGLKSPVYNSSKAAVSQLCRNLAMEWGKHGIRINALCPGHIVTPMVQKNFEEVPGLRETWERENMLGRLASPEEFTGATIFLLSDSSSFMTGSNLVIDGGHTAW
ncbi:hypothetical protein FE257_012733 [Aspergillus nanangensis]|uniref:Uncharacterized protein n=1 Tax=Aspergillus nanangensis TaxID=2582783 RepID=A0AAD4GQM2_ASPNN|nr:hypothetical protein FE257_012733 [Aspergillus nanangensis]